MMQIKTDIWQSDLTNYMEHCVQIHDGNFTVIGKNWKWVIISMSNFSGSFCL